MSILDPKWDAYLRLQTTCINRSRCDAKGFALEAALDRVIDVIENPSAALVMKDEIAAEISRTRKRESARIKLVAELEGRLISGFRLSLGSDFESRLQARDQYRVIVKALSNDDATIAVRAAFGDSSEEIASLMNISAPAVRQRLLRIRRKIAFAA
ncbi:hypothetical protein ACQY1M_25160 (plasmid) [Neorhizobium sp. DAR64861/K0K2]|uniref:hypothetical protein n=1 Tax=Neorhizobium sp. DAR64861/K0K2 TaxID=3421956 RepID=UPI003D27487C